MVLQSVKQKLQSKDEVRSLKQENTAVLFHSIELLLTSIEEEEKNIVKIIQFEKSLQCNIITRNDSH